MRSRICLCLLFLALLTPMAGGAADHPPLCSGEAMLLSAVSPEASPVQQAVPPFPQRRCGACSLDGCGGSVWYSRCGGVTQTPKYCVDIAVCTADGSLQCACRQAQ